MAVGQGSEPGCGLLCRQVSLALAQHLVAHHELLHLKHDRRGNDPTSVCEATQDLPIDLYRLRVALASYTYRGRAEQWREVESMELPVTEGERDRGH